MAGRSEHSRYVRGLATQIAADRFADTAILRDAIVNNTNHVLDQRGNVLVMSSSRTWTSPEAQDASQWHLLFGLQPQRFPITILSSGRSALIVPRIRGYASGGAGTASFRVRLCRLGGGGVPVVSDSCSEVSTTSTTGADLDPDPIFLTREEVEAPGFFGAAQIERSFPSLDGGGDAATVRVAMAQIEVWGAITAGAALAPVLAGISAREFIGG